jgi:hypothetical protein
MQKSNNTEEREKTMKKIVILSAMMFAVALWFVSTVSATETTVDVNELTTPAEECGDSACDPSNDNDIKSISATSDGDNIVVTVTMCGDFDDDDPDTKGKRMVKYRLHIDHKSPEGARYPDGHEFTMDDEVDLDDCETSDDDGVMFRVHKNGKRTVYGPGKVDTNTSDVLVFTVPYAGLLDDQETPVAVVADDVVHLWVDVQQKGICDRAPNTDDTDECAKPEISDEVISIKLQ